MDDCSLWEFRAAVEGWIAAHGGESGPQAPTPEEFEAAVKASYEVDQRIASRKKQGRSNGD